MKTPQTPQEEIPSTADRILDAAEQLFATKGYKATSLSDVADQVGIRAPSLYNHFRNKEALYRAVLQRLLQHFQPLIKRATIQPRQSTEQTVQWAGEMVDIFFAHPNFARLLQHAALAPTPGTEALLAEIFRPLFAHGNASESYLPATLQPWATTAFINILVSYITMAPLYRGLIDLDPFSPEAKSRHHTLVSTLVEALLLNPKVRTTKRR